jgi:hypothetical protein
VSKDISGCEIVGSFFFLLDNVCLLFFVSQMVL